ARPRLLLLDEPSLGLAPQVVQTIFKIIREINASGTTILLVEQNAHMALKVARRAYVLEVGRIVMSGPAEELAESDEVRKAYLGGGCGAARDRDARRRPAPPGRLKGPPMFSGKNLVSRILLHVRRTLVAGTLAVFPLIVTYWVVRWLFGFLDGIFAP